MADTRRALISGITGQDGSYLAEYLLSLGFEIHGLVRPVTLEQPDDGLGRIGRIRDRVILHPCTIENYSSVLSTVASERFDHCYHLAAAQSFGVNSFIEGVSTMATNTNSTHHLLAALHEVQPSCGFFFAGSSEMFGKAWESPQRETTPFHPRNLYGISKVTGYYLTMNYREAYDMFCVTGILFNHESPRRGSEFVTRKISRQVASIKLGMADELRLGNLDARRDWGHAEDYVRAMHLMLEHNTPDDYVIATGQTHSVREFCELAFAEAGLDYRRYTEEDARFYRPEDGHVLVGDSSKARRVLGWAPRHTFPELVREMVQHDLRSLSSTAHR